MILALLWFAIYSVKATIILGAAWLVNLCLRKRSASLRHFVWLAAFSSALLMPALEAIVPVSNLEVVPRLGSPASVQPKATHLALFHDGLGASGPSDSKTVISLENEPIDRELPAIVASDFSSGAVSRWNTSPSLLPNLACGLILLGMAATLLSGFFAYFVVQCLPARSLQAPSRWSHLANLRRDWSLRQSLSDRPRTAMTWGVARPVVLMPLGSASWRLERFESVVLHELAHVSRYDGLTQLIAFLLCSLHWFNPVCWICAKAMKTEAEKASDDLVLKFGVKPSSYASALVQTAAELSGRGFHFAPLGVFFMKQSKIESRVEAILDSGRNRRGMTTVQTVIALAAACTLILPLATVREHRDSVLTEKVVAPQANLKTVKLNSSIEAHPYRYLSGVITTKARWLVVIHMGGNSAPTIVWPGMTIPGTHWKVISIDRNKALLRRTDNVLPREVIVKLEVPPVIHRANRRARLHALNALSGHLYAPPAYEQQLKRLKSELDQAKRQMQMSHKAQLDAKSGLIQQLYRQRDLAKEQAAAIDQFKRADTAQREAAIKQGKGVYQLSLDIAYEQGKIVVKQKDKAVANALALEYEEFYKLDRALSDKDQAKGQLDLATADALIARGSPNYELQAASADQVKRALEDSLSGSSSSKQHPPYQEIADEYARVSHQQQRSRDKVAIDEIVSKALVADSKILLAKDRLRQLRKNQPERLREIEKVRLELVRAVKELEALEKKIKALRHSG